MYEGWLPRNQSVEGAKPSEARWYSVKPLHKGIPSLADLLEVMSENLQIILMKAERLETWDNATNYLASNCPNSKAFIPSICFKKHVRQQDGKSRDLNPNNGFC
jgi:hypothetical protein